MSAPARIPPDPSAGREARRVYFDGMYGDRDEPWDYSQRGAETIRHELVVHTVDSLAGTGARRVLDVGCSLGQLTARLAGIGAEVHAFDLSPTAVRGARVRCLQSAAATDPGRRSSFHFHVGSATELALPDSSVDLLLLCDGLVSWRLTEAEQRQVLDEARRVLAPGGYVVLTDALKPRQITPFLEQLRRSPLQVLTTRLLHDRLWYSVERGLRPVQHWRGVRAALASRRVARALSALSRLAGQRGTKHVFALARRPVAGEPGA